MLFGTSISCTKAVQYRRYGVVSLMLKQRTSYWLIGPVAWTSLKCKWHFALTPVSIRVLRTKWGKRQLTTVYFVKRVQNDVDDGVMRDAKW